LLADRRYRIAAAAAAGDEEDDIPYNHVSDYAPFFEIDAHWQESSANSSSSSSDNTTAPMMELAESVQKNHARLGRRVFNTHLRWDMLPKKREVAATSSCIQQQKDDDDNNDGKEERRRPQCGKFIYITRNQIDVVTSFYHHLSNQKEGTYTDTFETFVTDWMDGKIPFGSSLDHLMSFAEGFAVDNALYDTTSSSDDDDTSSCSSSIGQPLLLLSYEQLKSSLRTEVHRIISFLNLTHIPMHVLNEELLPSFEFHSMKNNIHKFQPKSVGWLNGFQFLRRGVVGDGRRLMLLNSKSGNDDSSTDNGGDGDGEGKSSELMDAYNDWVEREGYRSKISTLLQDDCNEECREVFLSVV